MRTQIRMCGRDTDLNHFVRIILYLNVTILAISSYRLSLT